ncbi:PREDICTED: uncharacterized protein LOC108615107 isoform X2 [Drosophila arizonae]|uniref:Uncharacterized protein LOC108615107 isoform X2 n=1 Tax=Drosophila arizonae TaxID=7263 RepID=A0ABM1PCA3_DROAR|nr:PREDICTED: uncharacterized protein LOC108615107 isoform X2 [Drosophila arizonae]
MKWFALCVLMLALLGLIAAAPSGQIRVRTSSTTKVHVRNGNIKWNGNCHNCDIRTTKNTAQVTSTRTKQWTRKW